MEQHLHEAIVSLSRDNRLPADSHQTMATVLIPIEEHSVGGELVPTVSARALHSWLKNGQEFARWLQTRIDQFGFVQAADFAPADVGGRGERGGQAPRCLPRDADYRLTLDMAKELAMVECSERGRQARQYFIAAERRLRATAPGPEVFQVLSDPNNLRTLLLDFSERMIAMEAKLAEDAPKVAFHDALVGAANTQSIQEVAKVLGVGAVKFFEWLRRAGLLMHNNLPYQCHIDAGYFKVVQRSFVDKHNEKHLYARTLVTGKGLAFLQRRYQESHLNMTAA